MEDPSFSLPLLVAVPSELPGGLRSPFFTHAGRCSCFTIVRVTAERLEVLDVLVNPRGHGCRSPEVLEALRQRGVRIILMEMGGRRLVQSLLAAGVQPYRLTVPVSTVEEAVRAFISGYAQALTVDQACPGGRWGFSSHGS